MFRPVEADRLKRIFGLALPIVGGMVSQNVLNLVDTFMVGYLGNSALAAVGLGGFATFMCQALVLGVSSGVQATASRRKGEGRLSETAFSLNAGILLILIVAPILSTALFFLVPKFYPFLNSDANVVAQGAPYLQARVLAITFVGINIAFRGYWNGIDLSRLYMSTLIVMHASNILLNYMLIFGNFGAPELGVRGAGIGTALSSIIGTLYYIFLGFKYASKNGFLKKLPSGTELIGLARLSLPNGIQQLFLAAGFTTMYWIIGKIGTPELAAANVMINIMLMAILPGIGLGMASATLVGQALGRKNASDAANWGWDVAKVGFVALGCIGIPMWAAPDVGLSIFIHDPETLNIARFPMRLTGFTMSIEAISLILMHSLIGAGDTKRVMKISISFQWALFLPAAYVLGPVMGFGLVTVWILWGSYRSMQAFVYAAYWKKGKWSQIKV